ncbi:hypothetical protein IFM89_006731 [Coptis chinensis]|uniref:Reverse transcriptase zinc-binding domain-containing protein n=1 Tax=Coptis chinensis TaxID=261450 RepID=A0A835LV49_9MAGN|nr:hypothetical protein IFM89_006731 [Coptis chinensis]
MDQPLTQDEDHRIWCPNLKGEFATASANEDIRSKETKVIWHKVLWRAHIHPSTTANAWKLMRNCATTQEKLQRIGVQLVPRCEICKKGVENLNHLLWHCPFARGNCGNGFQVSSDSESASPV